MNLDEVIKIIENGANRIETIYGYYDVVAYRVGKIIRIDLKRKEGNMMEE